VLNGLQAGVRLRDNARHYRLYEPIWQEVYVRNTGTAAATFEEQVGYEVQGYPIVTDKTGKNIKVIQYFGMGFMILRSKTVPPGEMALVARNALGFYGAPGEKGKETVKEVAPGLSHTAEKMPMVLASAGTYRIQQRLTPTTAKGAPMNKELVTGKLEVEVSGEAAVAEGREKETYPDIKTAPIAWGPVQNGLQAGLLYLDKKTYYAVGERTRLVVALRNVGKEPITFRHETSFAFLNRPVITEANGMRFTVPVSPEPEWRPLNEMRMTGVTYDMTYAPSANGPSRLRETKIDPDQTVIGYFLSGIVIPSRWPVERQRFGGRATPGHYTLSQPFAVGLGNGEKLDTILMTGPRELTVYDPDRKQSTNDQ
jgi:hypothetical protein